MPTVTFDNHSIDCNVGDNLRKVLRAAKLPLYNGAAKVIHCRGLGTCGTCAIKVDGDVSPMTSVEKWRLGFPPHNLSNDLRLACQCEVQGDLKLQKFNGLWGHKTSHEVE